MRIVILLGSAACLGGCVVQQPLSPAPYPLQYAPPISYRTEPLYRPPLPAPQDATAPGAPVPLVAPNESPDNGPGNGPGSGTENGQAGGTPPGDNGAIPLQDMPAPAGSAPPPDTSGPVTNPTTPDQPTRMPSQSSPIAGRGNNVPLEGFRPMRTQTQPTP